MAKIIGIDLGKTNSAVAVLDHKSGRQSYDSFRRIIQKRRNASW